jgi:hypothetical protein
MPYMVVTPNKGKRMTDYHTMLAALRPARDNMKGARMKIWLDKERCTLQNALFCAAAEYDKIAMQMNGAGQLQLAEQFARQAKEARQLNDTLETEADIHIS